MITTWNAFMPIIVSARADEPNVDSRWRVAMGVNDEALSVLRHVRRDVLPLVRRLQKRANLQSFSFLVHDRASGVPCPPEDFSAYIHLRLSFDQMSLTRLRRLLPDAWVYLTAVKKEKKGSRDGREEALLSLLDAQSAWYLSLVEMGRDLDDVSLLIQVGQHLHYFANMSQMAVR